MKLFKHLLAVIIGTAAFVFIYGICTIIIEFIGNIPVIGSILYYPSDASWALIAIPAPTAVFVAAWLSTKITDTAKPISVIMAVFWILNIVSMFVFHSFTWSELFRSLFGAGASCFCFSMDDGENTKNHGNKSYLVVDKETGEVVDEEYRPK